MVVRLGYGSDISHVLLTPELPPLVWRLTLHRREIYPRIAAGFTSQGMGEVNTALAAAAAVRRTEGAICLLIEEAFPPL